MLLAIDCGNTNVVFGVYDGETKRKHWRLSTNAKRTADEYAVDCCIDLKALEKLTPADIDGAIIASVVPAAVRSLKVLCQEHFDVTPLVIGAPGVELGIDRSRASRPAPTAWSTRLPVTGATAVR